MERCPEFKIEVSILKDVATVMIDTTGSSLLNVVIVRKRWSADQGKHGSSHFTTIQLVSRQALDWSNLWFRNLLYRGGYDCSKDGSWPSPFLCFWGLELGQRSANPGSSYEAAKKMDRELELDITGCDIDARMVEIAKAMPKLQASQVTSPC